MRGDGSRVEHESSPLNEQGLTSAATLGDVSTRALGHLQSGKDLKGKKKKKRKEKTRQTHTEGHLSQTYIYFKAIIQNSLVQMGQF